MMKLLLMELDNVLYNSRLLKAIAREWAVTAMREAGLPVEHEIAIETLMEVVKDKGEDYPFHFDEMMIRLGLKKDFRVIAAGVIAYHDIKRAFLRPQPGIMELVMRARDMGLTIGVISRGEPVKEWEKVLRLGIHHIAHKIWIGRDVSIRSILSEGFKPEETIFVVWNPENFNEAKELGIKHLVKLSDGKIEVFEEGVLIKEGELWRLKDVVESLLGRQ